MQSGEIKYPTEPSYNDFFRAYGSAMFAWQEVETALFKLYHSMNVLAGKLDVMVSSNAYYRKKSFGPKLTLVDKLANTSTHIHSSTGSR